VKFAVHTTVAGSQARGATLETARDTIATPVFMPVGTRASVRTQTLAQLAALDAPILLANTYHLLVRPGIDVFERFGGLHRWMGWPRSILTDSGGFQIFSLPGTTIDEAGAALHRPDRPPLRLSPERSIAMQRAIGADIMMVLDHCIASTSAHAEAEAAMHRTHRWAERSLAARGDGDAALFAIVQGACFPDLRRASARVLTELGELGDRGFDGYAIGGLAVGESRAQRQDTTELVTALLPEHRPRYLMGVGMPIDLLEAVHRGVDMFDCILPTALAQQGIAFTSRGRIDLARGVHRLAEQPLDPACTCDACTRTPRSYLHHLVKCQEPLGWQLLAFHNLAFYGRLMADIRAHIRAGSFLTFYAAQRELLERADPDHPPGRRPRVKPTKPRRRGEFALHDAPGGGVRLQHLPSGEILDAVDDPDAARIYVERSAQLARTLTGSPRLEAPTPAREIPPPAADSSAPPGTPHASTNPPPARELPQPAAHSSAPPATSHASTNPPPTSAPPHGAAALPSPARPPHTSAAPRPILVWDVELGAGRTAMAMIRALDDAAERGVVHAPIELVSFARDLDGFRLALAHVEHFPHLRHRAPHVALHRGQFHRDGLTWSVCEGDFLTMFPAQPAPDVIFYDPFPATLDDSLWSSASFTRLLAHCSQPVELFTATSSGEVRSALLTAGFLVTRGVSSGRHIETTIARNHQPPAQSAHPAHSLT